MCGGHARLNNMRLDRVMLVTLGVTLAWRQNNSNKNNNKNKQTNKQKVNIYTASDFLQV